ncbi:MAG TPA: glycosyltransferase [Actinomycetota bacterium]|nr:glycosyltransferase [Actinomycetota bacterium]
MPEFLMTTWHGAGTTPPLMSVAKALVSRGHRVRVLADSLLRPEVEAAGAEHIPWTSAPQRTMPGRDDDFVRDWETQDPAESFARTRDRLVVGPAALYAKDVREQLERHRPAALLTELLLMGPLIAAEAAGVPSIVLDPTINIIPSEGVPPFGFGFLPAVNDEERERDRMFGAIAMQAWDEALPVLNAARAENGLTPLQHVLDQGRTAVRVLVLSSASFDFQGPLAPTVKHVGPRLDDVSWAGKWEAPEGTDPLVLVAMSTDFQDQQPLLQKVAEALGELPVRGVITTGRGVDPADVKAPGNVQVMASAPHAEVLRDCAVTVTHGGHGTTIKSLAAGVPLVCLPIGRDQLDVAARVTHAGAGIRLEPSASTQEIAAAVLSVLDDPRYRAAAGRIAEAIARETATDQAVTEIEAVLAEQTQSVPA